jgi:hypothetical protein
MAQIVAYVGLGLLAITAIIVIFNLLKGLIRGLKKTIGSLVAIIISAIAAAIVTSIVCTPTSSLMVMLMDLIKNNISELQDIFAIGELSDALSHYLTMLIAPFFFLAAYILISLVVSIIVGIVVRFIPPHKKPAAVVHRLGGLGVGIVCGIVVSLILLMPVVGVLDIAATAGEELLAPEQNENVPAEAMEADTNEDAVMNEITAALVALSEDKVIGVYRAGSGWMFNLLASTSFEGERIYLKEDVSAILTILNNAGGLAGNMTEFGQEQVDAMNGLIDGLDKSVLLKHTLSGIVSDVAGKWASGESFMGMEKVDAGELLNPMVDTMLNVMATTTKDTISGDLRTVTDIVGILVEHDMLSDSGDFKHMLTKLGEEGVMSQLIITANHNPRMSALSDQITQLSVRALASTLGIPESIDERYDMLMSDIADGLAQSMYLPEDVREAVVCQTVAEALEEYGVEVDAEAAQSLALGLMNDFASNGELSGEDVEEFFLIYSAAAPSDVVYSQNGSAFDLVADTEGNKLVINSDGTVSVGDRVLKNYNFNNYADSAAYRMGTQHVDIGDADTLYSAESMKSSIITLEEICANVKKYSDCADPDGEAVKIANMFMSAADMFTGEGMDDLTYDQMIAKMGGLLDRMVETEIFGADTIHSLLKAILQSDMIREEMHLSLKDVNDFADKINNSVDGKDYTYSEATNTVSDTIDMMTSITNTDLTNEEKKEKTQKLLTNMTPDNAEMLSAMVSPSLMVSYGTPEGRAEQVSDSVSLLFDNMANFSTGAGADASEEEYAKEADAVNKVLKLAMEGTSSDENDNSKSLFNNENGEGKIDVTVEEFVDLMAGSHVVSQTLTDTVYEQNGGESPYSITTGEEEKAEVAEAINNYYEANKTSDNDVELQKTLNAIAIVVDVDAPFDVDGATAE